MRKHESTKERNKSMGKKETGYSVIGIAYIALFILVGAVGSVYIYSTWLNYTARMHKEAVCLASTAASFIDADQLMDIQGDIYDSTSVDHQTLKHRLINLEEGNERIGFAYLLAMTDGKIYIIVDSEASDSERYLQPGREYTKAPEQAAAAFAGGEPVLSTPWTDSRGKRISAFVPVKALQTGEVVAVLGVDYPAKIRNAEISVQVLRAATVVACILTLLSLLYVSARNRHRLKSLSRNLEENEILFKTVFRQAPIGIALVNGSTFLMDMNLEFARIVGRPREELAAMDWRDITYPEDLDKDLELFIRFKNGEIPGYTMEKRFIRPGGAYKWINMTIVRLDLGGEDVKDCPHICMIQDIHERKIAEEALKESERSKEVLLENLPGMAYRCRYDKYFTMEFVSKGCYELTGYRAESLIGNKDIPFSDIIAPNYGDILRGAWARALELRGPLRCEYEIITAAGTRKWVLETGQGIFAEDGSVSALEGIIVDITESRLRQNQIEYINTHDFLTGLYNRKYYEMEKRRLNVEGGAPLSVILADINGVRLVNEAFGHAEGDRLIVRAANILKSCCREGDLLARTGGDEYSILLPGTGSEQTCGIIKAIGQACEEANSQISDPARRISLSVGYGIKEDGLISLDEAEKEAEEHLRRRKFFERKSIKNAMLSSIMATLYARSQETEEHSRRISDNCIKVAEKLGLPQSRQDDLHLTAMLHDVGKVGIADRILNKPGKLNDAEWKVMKTHPEIGYHLVMSVPELAAVSDYILAHHERWDGSRLPARLIRRGYSAAIPDFGRSRRIRRDA